MRPVCFKVDEELLERLDRYAAATGKTRSEVIRRAVEFYLKLEDWRNRPRPKYVRLEL